MLLCHYATLFVHFVVWSTTSETAAASAFLHPPRRAHSPHPSSTPKRKVLLASIDDDSATSSIATQLVGKGKESSPSLTREGISEEEPFSLSVESMNDAVSGEELLSSGTVELKTIDRKSKELSRWRRRLVTSEDAFSVHKLSAVVYTLTSFTMMGTAAYRWLAGRQELFAVVPDFLEPVMYLFCISNFFMASASIRMAWLYRSNNVASRNAFVGTAGSSLFSAYFLVWASPFAPEFVTTPLASQIGFGVLCGWNIILITDTMIRAKDIINDRRDKKSLDEDSPFALEYLRYIISAAWPLPVIASTGYISSVLHDHAYVIGVFDQILKTDGLGMQASVFYNNVGGSMAAAYGSFFITLRDKMLISKQAEWVGIAAFSFPVLIWTIDVSARFFPYLLGVAALDQ